MTKRKVMAANDVLPDEKTIVMIAPRLSTVKRCDRIVDMHKGRVIGCDNWGALLQDNETFQRIARTHDAA